MASASDLQVVALSAAGWVFLWFALFYALSSTHARWARGIPPSTKSFEDNPYYCARSVLGIIHAIVIAGATVPAFFVLLPASDDLRYPWCTNFAFCSPPEDDALHLPLAFVYEAIAQAGLAFTCFTFVDLIISVVHDLAEWDYYVHHAAFVVCGVLIRSNCMLPFNAAALMAMEVSTPFLNSMLYFRHRGERYTFIVTWTGIAFFVLFVVFRLGLNTYATFTLLWKRVSIAPPYVHPWVFDFLVVALLTGSAVQFFWFPRIAKVFVSKFIDIVRGASETRSPQERPSTAACEQSGSSSLQKPLMHKEKAVSAS